MFNNTNNNNYQMQQQRQRKPQQQQQQQMYQQVPQRQQQQQLFQQQMPQQQQLQQQMQYQAPPQFNQQQFLPQMQQQQCYPRIFGFQSQNTIPNYSYDDDEPLDIQNKNQMELEYAKQSTSDKQQQSYNLEENISFTISSLHKAVKLSKNQTQTIPAMVSVKSKDSENLQSKRLGIDLICIIDKSGSMQRDNKMTSVIKSLNYIIDLMGENDRLCLITFDSEIKRILPFKRVTKQNIPEMKQIVNQLQASGGNNLKDAVQVAIDAFKGRKQTNYVNSIFLLADGQDPYPTILDTPQGQLNDGNDYTIHTFGYGSDHDPKLMQDVANAKGGSFYYVEDMNTADEFFIDALGGLFSVVGQNLKITIKSKSENKKFSDVTIAQTYGPMWTNNQQDNTRIVKISHLLCGVSKEFVLDLQVPPIFTNLEDYERNPVLLEGTLEIEPIEGDQKQTKIFKASLEMTFYNENENIPPEISQKNEDVELNYLRVQGAQALNDCMKQAESGNFQQAQNIIQNVNQKLQKASNNNQQQLQMLQQDLNKAQQTTQSRQQYYNQGGQKHLLYQQNAHFQQQSMPQQQQQNNLFSNNNNNYANNCQKRMVQQQQQMKQQNPYY